MDAFVDLPPRSSRPTSTASWTSRATRRSRCRPSSRRWALRPAALTSACTPGCRTRGAVRPTRRSAPAAVTCRRSSFSPVSAASVAGRSGTHARRRGGDRRRCPVRGHCRHRHRRAPVGRPDQPGRQDRGAGGLRAGRGGAPAVALSVAKTNTTYVMVRNPGAGMWRVSAAPGSSAISQVRQARGYAAPTLHARISGHGATRRLTYTVTSRPSLSIAFAERAHRVYRILGTAKGAHGSLRFTPAAGPAGKRTVYAIVSEGGIARESVPVTSYHAPAPATPARVRGLRVRRHRRTFAISFGNARGAAYYLLSCVAPTGAICCGSSAAGTTRSRCPTSATRTTSPSR